MGDKAGTEHVGLARMPALDGLRGLAVLAVLAFHARVGLSGGFLGVSLFFTLSGFLITSLLLVERSTTGRIDLSAFYARRLRRLVPASLLCIVMVLAAGTWWSAAQRRDLSGDTVAALANVANWRFALGTSTYQDLFVGAPSPLAHFWSLAIEEQAYVVLPLLAAVCLRRSRRTLAVVTWTLLTASVGATLLTADTDLVYQGTHTRAAELLIGVLLAVVLAGTRRPAREEAPSRRRFVGATGWMALGSLGALNVVASTDDIWIYRGGLPGVALLSALVIAVVSTGAGPARVLAVRPLVAVGKVSYGLYLFHWPVFVLLDDTRTGLGTAALLVARIGVTTVLTLASYWLVEQPIRLRRVLVRPARALLAGTVAVTAIAAAMVTLPPPEFTATEELLAVGESGLVRFGPTPPPIGELGIEATIEPSIGQIVEQSLATRATRATEGTVGTVSERPTILVVGSDPAPVGWLNRIGANVVDAVARGCAVASAVEIRLPDGNVVAQDRCERSADRWATEIANHRPDLVVVAVGTIDRGLLRRQADEGYPTIDDLPAVAERWDVAEDDLVDAMDVVLALDVPVVVADAGSATGGTFTEILARLDLHHPQIDGIETRAVGLVGTVHAALSGSSPELDSGDSLRVLVTGDSTSLDLARALSDGSEGSLDVTWAGENGCPWARVQAFRFRSDEPWLQNDCIPFDRRLRPLLDDVRPDVVLLAVTVLELAEQRYPGDDTGHVAGDPAFVAFHDAEIDALLDLLGEHRIPLLIADSIGVRAGGFATPEMADPTRLAGWNDQIASWDGRRPSVTVFPYAGPLLVTIDHFGAEVMVPDGVHPAVGPLTELARWVYAPLLHEQVAALAIPD